MCLITMAKKLLSLCKSTNHIIANSRLLQGIEGNCTFCSQRSLSVTDYLLLNMNDINMLHNFEILNWTHFSDHAALSFSLRRKCIETNESKQQEQVIYETKITIDEQKTTKIKGHLGRNLHQLNSDNEQTPDINTQIEQSTTFLAKTSTDIFGQKVPIKPNNSHKKSHMPKWFDEECYR